MPATPAISTREQAHTRLVPMARKQVEALFNGPVAKRAVPARFGECAAIGANLVRAQAVDIRLIPFDELQGKLIEAFEIVRRVVQGIPLKSEPGNVLLDCVNVF